MRYMILIKASKDSEAGVMPREQLLTAMGQLQRRPGESRDYAGR